MVTREENEVLTRTGPGTPNTVEVVGNVTRVTAAAVRAFAVCLGAGGHREWLGLRT